MTTALETAFDLPQWCAGFDPVQARTARHGSSGEPDVLTTSGPGGAEFVRHGPGLQTVIFDGYLYDRARLTRELDAPSSAGDAELAAAACARWGREVYDRLDGCFLLAVWNAATGRLLVGHDALGRHPVFYCDDGSRFWFGANVLKVAARARSRRANRHSLALGALLFWPDRGETFFEDVARLPPGQFLEVDDTRRINRHQYWEPMPGDDEPWLRAAEVHERFEPALVAAVERRMALDPQGIMLSGGVDSVTVAALAVDVLGGPGRKPFTAVSARAGGPLTGEERMQSAVSDALGMRHLISTTREWLRDDDEVEASLAITPELPAPTRIWWVGAYTRFYRRTADEGLHVLLTGAGGDNWLGVADAHAADLMRRLAVSRLLRFLEADVATGGASWASAARRLLWAGGLRPILTSRWARLAPVSKARYHRRQWERRLPAWLCPEPGLRAEVLDRLLARRTPDLSPAGKRPASYYRHSLKTLDNPYLHHENENAFHIERACRLRLLSPYHDRALVSFLNRIAPDTLVFGDRYKGLLRPVVARRLPGLGLDNQRKDYPSDLQAAKLARLRGSLEAASATSSFDVLPELGIVDPDALARHSEPWSGLSFEALAARFYLLSAERWLRAHVS
ncbi:MAG TPA: asparagine synthase-related protein [Vicinamibacterales bacterium]|nr:asparagine synthase-related protein [Vicinamibacterales bacterium]